MNTAATKKPEVIDSRWIRFRAAAYLGGRGLSWGCANDPIVPKEAMDGGKYSINIYVLRSDRTAVCDTNIDFIANNSMDHCFVGARDNPPLRDMVLKLKPGGHLVIHAHNGDPEVIRPLVANQGYWQEKDIYLRDNQFLGVWKLLNKSKNGVLPPKPKAEKRACIARYGAIGDMIMLTPLIRKLHEDGYHLTLNVTPYCAEVLKHNPYVDNIILQERDMIPNQDLGAYWQEWIGDYDKYINLSESVEGKLLKVENRRDFYTTKEWRQATCDTNYIDNTMRLGGYPDVLGAKPELHFSNAEIKEAKRLREKFKNHFLILWNVKGSSYHKIYPLMEPVLREWLPRHPNAIVMFCGQASDSQYAIKHPQCINMCGTVGIRDVFCLTQFVDMVVGPESAVINAASCYPTPKITFLSHSSHNNLCVYWDNDFCLAPTTACSPCHQLHYTLESCPLMDIHKQDTGERIGTYPACSVNGILPERLISRLDEVFNKAKDGLLV